MPARLFWLSLAFIVSAYLLFWLLLIGATALYSTPQAWLDTLLKPEIRYATGLSLITCTAAAAFALLVAVPIGYLMARRQFPGKSLVDAALDIPIVLPPMVIGLCLLIFFQTLIGKAIESVIPFTYTVAGVILAQFVVAAAFAIRTVRGTFDHLSPRPEDVALTLGATRFQALWHIALPSARRGLVAAFCIAWARSLGEFGPILVFAGATRNRTEVLPTTVWLELSVGNLESAVAVSLVMILIAVAVLLVVRASGERV
ncbi:molybdate transport system permease protein [Prosthecobacter fusiformis]|uniref:Molybdate transport system permease protein n=1 Tax=Prosthecobacter fusiformis TaxID=48464 RepID=A0A4R7S0D9_9BACT|nr:ABC transporter permease [Prosthecobacter fusiformis]TDU70615.1 molybdate transport system permease protein [Prosthecobacter fusiformis]